MNMISLPRVAGRLAKITQMTSPKEKSTTCKIFPVRKENGNQTTTKLNKPVPPLQSLTNLNIAYRPLFASLLG